VAGELASIVALIACGVGVGLLPRLGLPADLERVRVVPGLSPVVRTVYAVTRRTHSKGAVGDAVQSLRAVAKDVAGREILRWDNLRR
jgi:DNA-binding transcriptional LysR family regulator